MSDKSKVYQTVAECRKHRERGNFYWVGKMACGCAFRRLRQAFKSNIVRPAPRRLKCNQHAPGGGVGG